MVGRPLRIGEDQRLGEMGEKLVQPEQLVALAHALAVAVDEHEDRRPPPWPHHVQDMAESWMASSTPSAVRSATPITSDPAGRNGPSPLTSAVRRS